MYSACLLFLMNTEATMTLLGNGNNSGTALALSFLS